MYLRMALLGAHHQDREFLDRQSVVLRAIECAADVKVRLSGVNEADLIIIFPYQKVFSSNMLGTTTSTLLRRFGWTDSPKQLESLFRRTFSIKKSAKLLAISPENLERSPWTNYGDFLRITDIPRLTPWPTEIDSGGFRFPHWWSFVRWPELASPPKPTKTRFGEMYELELLCSSRPYHIEGRFERAVWITNHLDFPRKSILDLLSKYVEVDILQNVPWGEKVDVLRRYRYCVTSENSAGLGYETEKVPDAVVAGCIPIGYIANPMGDFNSQSYFFSPPEYQIEELPPLLESIPQLSGLISYLGRRLFFE